MNCRYFALVCGIPHIATQEIAITQKMSGGSSRHHSSFTLGNIAIDI